MTSSPHVSVEFLIAVLSLALSGVSYAAVPANTADGSLNAEELYWQRLEEIRSDRNYSDDVATGTFDRFHELDGFDTRFHYTVEVPDTYDPRQKIDLHIYLHGGVGMSSNRIAKAKIRRLKRLQIDDAISVFPSAWPSAKWWFESQAKNVVTIINSLKESYNIDENRVFLHGLSDGAAGAYYFTSHLPTPFAGFIALVGSPHVLRPRHRVFGTMFPGNLVNKPIFAVNTEDDHLFPAESVEALFEAVNRNHGNITFHTMPGDHFGMPWLSTLKKDYENFVAENTRNPYPDYLFWQIDEESDFKRIHWLVVNGTRGGDTESAVAVTKDGNSIYLSSNNVAAVTLLVSSEHFDLSENIQVWSNRKLVFDQKLSPKVHVLEKWFKLDQDKSMLFANEIYLDALP